MRVVLASANKGKLRELAALLAPEGLELETQAAHGIEPPPETGLTFVENAMIKACHAAQLTGLAALADDSGIEVDALGGRPGVYSARYAGERASDRDNLEKLLQELKGTPPELRTARYRCALVLLRGGDDPEPTVALGQWEGYIANTARGTGGFGYDPIFVPLGDTRTAAQMPAEEKNQVSHRAQALLQLRTALRDRRTPLKSDNTHSSGVPNASTLERSGAR